jgi:hypothetical protein
VNVVGWGEHGWGNIGSSPSETKRGFVSKIINYLLGCYNIRARSLKGDYWSSYHFLGRVWESSSSEKIALELQIHRSPPWNSSTADLRSSKMFGTAPDSSSSL